MTIKAGDYVIILRGEFKGQQARVSQILESRGKIKNWYVVYRYPRGKPTKMEYTAKELKIVRYLK